MTLASCAYPADTSSSPTPAIAGGAPCGDPTAHVYHTARLRLKNGCQTVSGTIRRIKAEIDGDFHVRLGLDTKYRGLLTAGNDQQQGDMVLEPVCVVPVRQNDAISSCSMYQNDMKIPPVGTHVIATGAYVFDLDHSGWAELHPLFDIHPG